MLSRLGISSRPGRSRSYATVRRGARVLLFESDPIADATKDDLELTERERPDQIIVRPLWNGARTSLSIVAYPLITTTCTGRVHCCAVFGTSNPSAPGRCRSVMTLSNSLAGWLPAARSSCAVATRSPCVRANSTSSSHLSISSSTIDTVVMSDPVPTESTSGLAIAEAAAAGMFPSGSIIGTRPTVLEWSAHPRPAARSRSVRRIGSTTTAVGDIDDTPQAADHPRR